MNSRTELDYSIICKETRITKLAVRRMNGGKLRGRVRRERWDPERASSATPSSTGPDGGPPTSKCTTERRWGEPVSTTKTPSRLTARNYDYRSPRMPGAGSPNEELRTVFPLEKSVSATSSRSITARSTPLTGRGRNFGTREPQIPPDPTYCG